MRRIEFFGIPGVGKTATYQELIKLKSTKKEWLFSSEAKKYSVLKKLQKEKKANLKQYLLYLFRKGLILLPLIGTATGISDFLIKEDKKELFHSFYKKNSQFVDICAGCFAEQNKESYRRFYGASLFYNLACELIFYEKHIENSTVIFDEGLAQKIFGVVDISSITERKIRDYFRYMPAPSGIVYFRCDDVTIVDERLKSRYKNKGKLLYSHKDLNDYTEWIGNAIKVTSITIDTLRNRGLSILEVPAELSASEKATEIKKFIRQI